MSLAESLERAASELRELGDQIRPSNGDPHRLLEGLDRDQAATLLVWILNEDVAGAEELVQVWGEEDAGASILVSLDEAAVAKPGRKLLRKARHRLRSRGIETPVSNAHSAPASHSRAAAVTGDRWQAAHLSAPDFRGARVGYLVDSHPAGGARLFEIRFDEARGILDFKIYNAGRSKVRGFLRSLTAGTGQSLFEVARDPLRSLVRRASLAQPVDRPLPTAFVEWRGRLFSEDLEQLDTPGDLARATLGDAATSSDASAGLDATFEDVREGRLGPWPPSTAWVGDWMTKGREAAEGLDGEARATAIESWIEEASEALVKETDDVLLGHHLDEMAWIRWQSEDEPAARVLLAVSDSLSRDEGVMRKMSRARVEGLFAPFLTELRVVEDDSTS
jgi:hypothetical protein